MASLCWTRSRGISSDKFLYLEAQILAYLHRGLLCPAVAVPAEPSHEAARRQLAGSDSKATPITAVQRSHRVQHQTTGGTEVDAVRPVLGQVLDKRCRI